MCSFDVDRICFDVMDRGTKDVACTASCRPDLARVRELSRKITETCMGELPVRHAVEAVVRTATASTCKCPLRNS